MVTHPDTVAAALAAQRDLAALRAGRVGPHFAEVDVQSAKRAPRLAAFAPPGVVAARLRAAIAGWPGLGGRLRPAGGR